MAMSAAEVRREKLRNRTKQSVQTRDQKGLGKKSILDWSRFQGKKPLVYVERSGKDLNIIDILPFVITQDWYKNLRTFSGLSTNLDVGDWDYKLEIPVHSGVGDGNDVLICNRLAFGGKCPDCEDMFAEYAKDEADQDEKKIKALKPSWRVWYNVYDYSEESNPDGVNGIWEDVSYYNFEKVILEEADEGEETVLFSDIELGKTLEIKGKEKQLGKNKFVEAGNVEFKDREPYSEDIVKETVSFDALVRLCTYEEFLTIRQGSGDSSSSGDQDSSAESSDTGPVRTRTRRPHPVSSKSEKKENSPDDLPWNEGTCPHGLTFGAPEEAAAECQQCADDIFKACAAEADKKTKSDDQTEAVPATGRRRRGK